MVAGVITASESSWIGPFTGLSLRLFGKLITALRREGADPVRKGRPWSLPLEDRVLLVAAYWSTNLSLRQLAPLFGVSKSAAYRIIDNLGPAVALQQRKRFRRGTVLIVDGTWCPPATTPSPSSRRITGTPPTTRSSSTPTPSSSSLSAGHCRATATTARHGSCPAQRMPSARPRSSRTAATGHQPGHPAPRRTRPDRTPGLEGGTQHFPSQGPRPRRARLRPDVRPGPRRESGRRVGFWVEAPQGEEGLGGQ